MVKIISLILAAVIAVVAIGTLGFLIVKTAGYMINQHFDIGTAISWSWQDYKNFVGGIFGGGAKAEDPNYFEYEITMNKNIPVVACTSL